VCLVQGIEPHCRFFNVVAQSSENESHQFSAVRLVFDDEYSLPVHTSLGRTNNAGLSLLRFGSSEVV